MAITYNLELDEIGVGVTTYTGIATTTYALGGLTASTDYQVRVREVNTISGVEVLSLWSSWTAFSTTVQQIDITAVLGTISNSQTVHAIVTSILLPEVVTTTYDLELTETGQSPTVTTGISPTNYSLTGLTVDTEYSVRVRQVKELNGGLSQSLWTAPVVFTAGQALPEPVVSLLGTISNSQTIHAMTTEVGGVPTPVVSPLGTITNSQTVHAITTDVELPDGEVAPDFWAITVTHVESDTTVVNDTTLTSDYSLTGLEANVFGGNEYRVGVTGRTDIGGASDEVTVDFSTVMLSVTEAATPTFSTEQAIDQFYVSAQEVYDKYSDIVLLFGDVNEAFDTITATFDSTPYTLTVDGLQFTGDVLETDPITLPAPSVLPGDVEILPTDWTGSSTAVSTDSATLTLSDTTTTDYKFNFGGKPSFKFASGTLAANYTHYWNNSEIVIPDNGSKADVVGRIRSDMDFTLTLVKNGDFANPVATTTSTTIDDAGNTRYQCDLSMTDIVVSGGDHFELSINRANPESLSPMGLALDPTLGFFTLTVTEVYV